MLTHRPFDYFTTNSVVIYLPCPGLVYRQSDIGDRQAKPTLLAESNRCYVQVTLKSTDILEFNTTPHCYKQIMLAGQSTLVCLLAHLLPQSEQKICKYFSILFSYLAAPKIFEHALHVETCGSCSLADVTTRKRHKQCDVMELHTFLVTLHRRIHRNALRAIF